MSTSLKEEQLASQRAESHLCTVVGDFVDKILITATTASKHGHRLSSSQKAKNSSGQELWPRSHHQGVGLWEVVST